MTRRKRINVTAIRRVEAIPYHDAWVAYQCVKCKKINYIRIGKELLSPREAVENCIWECKHCNFTHSKESDLPFENWEGEHSDASSMAALRFWEGFFRVATERPESYWKQCNVCCRILPFQSFSRHSMWGALERQMECRSCKGAINAILNPKRTREQLHESSVKRRIADLFLKEDNEIINIQDLFERFKHKCFKTKISLNINERDSWAIDHILPSKYLYPLKKENAALLSKSANEEKRDKWPSNFYENNQLIELAKITGADLTLISGAPVRNRDINVNKGVKRYLQVRENSDLSKRVKNIKKILQHYGLVDSLSLENKKLLGFD